MSTVGATERPPTPPRSTDGESSSVEVQSQSQPIEPYTPPRAILPAQRLEDKIASEHEDSKAPFGSQHANSYGDPSMYQTAAPANTFYPIQQTTFNSTTQLQTPPAAYDEGKILTRSGRALGSPLSPSFTNSSRVAKSLRTRSTPRPSKKSKAAKNGMPLIDQPLSSLTKDYKIPIKDMDAWVHRPVAERLQQATKNKDHISRPMNSFMLYRSAYADRAKHFCKENNHQVVSQVTGASWPLEPKEIREMYEEFARIERDAHHNAHPDYKFAPNKKGKNKSTHFDEDDDDDPEWQCPRRGKRSRTGTSGPTSRDPSSTPFDDRYQPSYHPTMHPSSYWASNPHGQRPMGMVPESYYQPLVNQYNQQVDDIVMRRMQFPQYEQPQLIGMPNNSHAALMAGLYPDQGHGDVLDPQLASGQQQYEYSQFETAQPGYAAPRTYEYGGYPFAHQQYYEEPAQSLHPGMATLIDDQNVWEQPGAEFDQVLERWS